MESALLFLLFFILFAVTVYAVYRYFPIPTDLASPTEPFSESLEEHIPEPEPPEPEVVEEPPVEQPQEEAPIRLTAYSHNVEKRCYSQERLSSEKYRQVIGIKPTHINKGNGWVEAPFDISDTNDSAFPVGVNGITDFKVKARLSGQAPVVHFGRGNSMVRFTPLGTNNTNGVVVDNSIHFPNAWNNADLTIRYGGHRLQKDILLATGHPSVFSFRIDENAGMNEDTLETADFRILDPLLTNGGLDNVPLTWEKSRQGGKLILTVRLPIGDWAGWTLDPTLTLQPDATDGIDTFTYIDQADASKGTNTGIWIYNTGSGTQCYGLVRFDISSLSNTTINSGTLSLFVSGLNHTTSGTVQINQVLSVNANWSETSTWNYCVPSTQRWAGDAGSNGGIDAGCSQSGTDYSSTSDGSVSWSSQPTGNTEHQFTLNTSRLTTMINANYGWNINIPTNAKYGRYCSSDHATAGNRPKLTVDYTLPGAYRRYWLLNR